jgi:aerobic C4-dicarboxylate transport protein
MKYRLLGRFFKQLYFRVLLGTLLGIAFGLVAPKWAIEMHFLGDTFISLIKMIIGPVIFCTVVQGISGTGSAKKVGRVGGKAILYFEVVSTFALFLGLLTVNLLKPGAGFHGNIGNLDASAVAQYADRAHGTSLIAILQNMVPKTLFDAFTGSGDMLQVLVVAILFGFALNHSSPKSDAFRGFVVSLSHVLFRIVNMLMELAPLGAFGAMSFTIGQFGLKSLGSLAALMGTFYLTCAIFIFGVLGLISWLVGFNIFKFIRYMRDELLLILGTSSSESALVPLMEKMEKLGCSKSTVGVVIPAGYSFNLDGTNIYLTMAAIFVAQAMGIDLTLGQQLSILLVAIVTSKGASGVTGAGFIALAATLSAVPTIPVKGLAIIFGIDRFMSEARAITNFIGNGVATLVVSKWEGELDLKSLNQRLNEPISLPDVLNEAARD